MINDEKVASSKQHTQFKTRVLKTYPIYNQNGQYRYLIYDQNGWKTLPAFRALHTYIAHIKENPSNIPPQMWPLWEKQIFYDSKKVAFTPIFVLTKKNPKQYFFYGEL